jgi:hypothetical protein
MRAKYALLALGLLVSTAAVAQKSTELDGLQVGMSTEEVMKALSSRTDLKQTSSSTYEYKDGTPANLAKAGFLVNNGNDGTLAVTFAAITGKLYRIERGARGSFLSEDIAAALTEKYGAPVYKGSQPNSHQFRWTYDKNGKAVNSAGCSLMPDCRIEIEGWWLKTMPVSAYRVWIYDYQIEREGDMLYTREENQRKAKADAEIAKKTSKPKL